VGLGVTVGVGWAVGVEVGNGVVGGAVGSGVTVGPVGSGAVGNSVVGGTVGSGVGPAGSGVTGAVGSGTSGPVGNGVTDAARAGALRTATTSRPAVRPVTSTPTAAMTGSRALRRAVRTRAVCRPTLLAPESMPLIIFPFVPTWPVMPTGKLTRSSTPSLARIPQRL
jgi:hypothetical protein